MGEYYGEVDASTGWSGILEYQSKNYEGKYDNDPSVYSSYRTMSARGFTNSYWTHWRWAKKFKNVTNMTLIIKSVTFHACTGHSGDNKSPETIQEFKTTNGRSHWVDGAGCTFYCDVFREGEGVSPLTSTEHILPKITHSNCSSKNGKYTTLSTEAGTSFGSLSYFNGVKDSAGNPIYIHPCKFTFSEDIVLKPGEAVYFVINTKNWNYHSGGRQEGFITIDNASASWEYEMEVEESSYIWVFNGTSWVKERSAYQFNSSSNWVKLE